ncbi:transcription initiation factor TFIID subunit 5-like isoform X1 [Halichondria panicea]|uniref:transcription initiation factor TFIID subunit 5-like isoform X1 n=1 Tax=Halichondria panicea TaxID=6063 RepID=UPI00312B7F66
MSTQMNASPDKAALATVLNYLRNKKLKGTEEALRKELTVLGQTEYSDLPIPVSTLGSSGTEPSKYGESYSGLLDFTERALDLYKSELSLLLYPVFVHLYIDLVVSGHAHPAQQFFHHYSEKQESFHEEELLRLKSITTPQQMVKHELFETFRKNKFTIRMSNDSFQCLDKHLQVNRNMLILRVINDLLELDVFDGTPRSKIDIRTTSGAIDGEASTKANKVKVMYGIPRDPDMTAALAQLEEEENEGHPDDEKPKKKKAKKDPINKKSKVTATPNAPPLTRIPLPKLRDCEQVAKFSSLKESAKCVPLSSAHLPSVCFYTLINTFGSLNAVSIADDATLLAGSFNDSIVRVWTLTPKKLCSLKPPSHMQQISLAAEDVLDRIMDLSSGSDVRQLIGHNGPVFSTSFNPDNSFLISGSEDGTVRLWSLQTFSALVCFKGHNYPVWSVQFSPTGFYFVSGSHDRTARVWSTEHIQPIRILAGHLSDVDCCQFHPNGNYIATGSCDRSVRLWDILSGQCVRIFTGHKGSIQTLAFSPDGKYLASAGADKRILIWDIGSASQQCELRGHKDTVYQLVFSRDGALLASGGGDNTVKLWDVAAFVDDDKAMEPLRCLLGSYPTKSTSVHCLHFTRRNLLLAAGPFNT